MTTSNGRERGARVLVVDDEEQIRKLLSLGLSRAGFHVATAADGTDALITIRDHGVPDLVITDVSMPIMNGFELTARLRSGRRTAGVPVVMLSAFSQPENIVKGYAQGADDYIPKPVEMPVLVAKIESLLRRSPRAVAASEEPGVVVAFAHAKGGAGTTTLAVNTAVVLAGRGERVALLDTSVEFPGVGISMNVKPVRTLADLAGMQRPVDDDTFESMCANAPGGAVVLTACDRTEQSELVTVPAIQEAIGYLARVADWVIVDCPTSLGERTLAALDAATRICLVTGVTLPAMQATADCLRVFDMVGYTDKTSMVVNRSTPGGLSFDQAAKFFQRAADVRVAYSDLFDEGANTGRPPALAHPASAAFAEVAGLAEHLRQVVGVGVAV